MFTLTITFKKTRHQIVLAFDTMESRNVQARKINSMADEKCDFTQVEDDYGQMATWKTTALLSTLLTDVAEHWRYRNKVSIIKLQAENDFNQLLGQDPTLKFLTGGIRPKFGSE